MGIKYKTIETAFEKADVLKKDIGRYGDINLSDIATALIQDCGRFAEFYASDMLISWDVVRRLTGTDNNHDTKTPITFGSSIIVFAIRDMGVDHDEFFMRRCLETKSEIYGYIHPKNVYRRILAVKVDTTPVNNGKPCCICTLKNLTNEFSRIHADDLPLLGLHPDTE